MPAAGRSAGRTGAADSLPRRAQVALAYAREVTELCALAGFADRAAKFITAETSVEQVRAALLEARATARRRTGDRREPRAARRANAGQDAGWGDAIARVCKQ